MPSVHDRIPFQPVAGTAQNNPGRMACLFGTGYRIVHRCGMPTVPMGAVRQRAVVPEENDPASAKVGSELNSSLTRVKRSAIGWAENLHTESGTCPLALCPQVCRSANCVAVVIPPVIICGKDMLAFRNRQPARVNCDNRQPGATGLGAIFFRQRWAAGDADVGFGMIFRQKNRPEGGLKDEWTD